MQCVLQSSHVSPTLPANSLCDVSARRQFGVTSVLTFFVDLSQNVPVVAKVEMTALPHMTT